MKIGFYVLLHDTASYGVRKLFRLRALFMFPVKWYFVRLFLYGPCLEFAADS